MQNNVILVALHNDHSNRDVPGNLFTTVSQSVVVNGLNRLRKSERNTTSIRSRRDWLNRKAAAMHG